METLKKLGWGNEHALDRLSIAEIENLKGFGKAGIKMVRMARGTESPMATNLMDPAEVEALVFGENESGIPLHSKADDGLVELKLVLRLPVRRLDWLERLSALSSKYNPDKPERNTIEALVVSMINKSCAADHTDAGRRTGMSTTPRNK